jgi:3-oxoacyl-[acyl-carrier protein] reductase
MKHVLISGGLGDWAQDFCELVKGSLSLSTPGRRELDVTSQYSINSYLESKKFDILINNAGTIHPKRILESDPEKWVQDFSVNVIGAYLLSKEILNRNRSAIIVNISSMAAFASYPDWSSYCSSKAALVTLSKCMANDGFNSYCICPGGFETKFRDNFDLDNSNLLTPREISMLVLSVITGGFQRGDVIAIRKGYFKINPEWCL